MLAVNKYLCINMPMDKSGELITGLSPEKAMQFSEAVSFVNAAHRAIRSEMSSRLAKIMQADEQLERLTQASILLSEDDPFSDMPGPLEEAERYEKKIIESDPELKALNDAGDDVWLFSRYLAKVTPDQIYSEDFDWKMVETYAVLENERQKVLEQGEADPIISLVI